MLDARRALSEAEVDQSRVRVVAAGSDLHQASPEMWLLLEGPHDSWIVGGSERGQLVIYDQYETLELAAGALHHLTASLPTRRLLGSEEMAASARGAVEYMRHLLSNEPGDGSPQDVTLKPGLTLDRFGPETGAATFPFRTPLPMRSLSPPESTSRYHIYVVRRPLGGGIRAGRVAPWFGQPGGGFKVMLPRCVRWYCDAGFVEEVEPAAGSPGIGVTETELRMD